MPRYDRWEKCDYSQLEKLKQSPLFNDHLLPDIKSGVVFPALRRDKIDFYHYGCKLFSFDGRGFRSNIAYLVAYQNRPEGEVTENSFRKLKLCESFLAGYEQIKANTRLYVKPEAKQVSVLCNNHSCCLSGTGPIVVLDIEFSLKAQDEARTSDRIDLILFDKITAELRFFEVKTFQNPDLKPLNGSIAVVGQIRRYSSQLITNCEPLLIGYVQYVRVLNMLLGDTTIPPPATIDKAVDLLVFDFNGAEEKVLLDTLIPTFGDQFHCSMRGETTGATQSTLAKWWRKGRPTIR